ncbi:MAG: T9SS type A sorting domain-containing protein [Bacteroidales bacterium]|nr:T9SS type A sorting domain-containing protein [Bacteroidales bacterium]
MKLPLIALFIMIFAPELYPQEYKKLADTTNKWNYLDSAFTTNGYGEAKTNSLFITNDTLVEGISYKKLMCKIIRQNDTSVVYAAGIREDTVNQMVFIKSIYGSEELLYSFIHAVGDTISIDTAFWNDYYTVRHVKSITTYDFNGFTGKKIEIVDSLYSIKNPNWPPAELTTEFWYEGIGSLNSIFNLYSIGNLPVLEVELLCFWNQNNFIYQSPGWSVCEYAIITSVNDRLILPDLRIYPIPASGRLIIATEAEIKEICLLDIYGKVIFSTPEKEMDISDFADGIYLLRIMTESGEIVVRKVIKSAL